MVVGCWWLSAVGVPGSEESDDGARSLVRRINMANLLEQAINSNDGDHAAKLIQNALGIESDSVAN